MKIRLIKTIYEAKGTKSFFWQPKKVVTWLPGQYFYYTLPFLKYPDARGATRHFTIANSPTEGPTLRLTTRIREESGFKKTLNELEIGENIEGEGPEGTFIFDESEQIGTHIFLAGGIGITPFRSFIKYCLDKGLNTPMYLIYSDSHDEDFAFKKELSEISKLHPNIKVEFVVTSKAGRLDEMKITNFIGNWKLEIGNSTLWVVGPPLFVDSMEAILSKMRVPADKVRTEKFTGY